MREETKEPRSPDGADASSHSTNVSVERGSADLGGQDELRKEPMMETLLNALEAGKDIGHYGRLVFAMVARHFLSHDEVIEWLTKDHDFSAEQAEVMLRQTEDRDYSPPRRERLVEWQSEQEFQFIDSNDPESGNLYRHLKFPQATYKHIEHYQEERLSK